MNTFATIGINTNILETNVVNLICVLVVLVNYGGKFVTSLLVERYDLIAANLDKAKQNNVEVMQKLEGIARKSIVLTLKWSLVDKPRLVAAFKNKKEDLTKRKNQEIARLSQTQQSLIQFEKDQLSSVFYQKLKELSVQKSLSVLKIHFGHAQPPF